MKYHTIKSERYNTRERGAYASYPIYEHANGNYIATLECYSCDVDMFIKDANKKGNIDFRPFYKD